MPTRFDPELIQETTGLPCSGRRKGMPTGNNGKPCADNHRECTRVRAYSRIRTYSSPAAKQRLPRRNKLHKRGQVRATTKPKATHNHWIPWQRATRLTGSHSDTAPDTRHHNQVTDPTCEAHLLPSTSEQEATLRHQRNGQVPMHNNKVSGQTREEAASMRSELR